MMLLYIGSILQYILYKTVFPEYTFYKTATFSYTFTLFISCIAWLHCITGTVFPQPWLQLRQNLPPTCPYSLLYINVYIRYMNFLLQVEKLWILEHTLALCFPFRKKKTGKFTAKVMVCSCSYDKYHHTGREKLSVLSFSSLFMANNLICNQPCALSHTISPPSNQAHSAIHRKPINMIFQRGVWQTVGRDLFVERGVLNFLSQE